MKLVALVLALLAFACSANSPAPPDLTPDADDASADATNVADAGAPDAEPTSDANALGSCADVCPDEDLSPWPQDDPAYCICRPSYEHCHVSSCR